MSSYSDFIPNSKESSLNLTVSINLSMFVSLRINNFTFSSYCRAHDGKLLNSLFVNKSHKAAAEGIISTVMDLNKFGNAMLYSLQATQHKIGELAVGFTANKSLLLNPVTGS